MCEGIHFLGTSGQNVHDLRLFSKLDDPSSVGALRLLMQMQHLCPTAPDTLRSFPFREEDPFIVKQAPHVFFAGCQPRYAEEIITQKGGAGVLKLLSVPTFALTRSIVLLDVNTLQSFELSFGDPL